MLLTNTIPLSTTTTVYCCIGVGPRDLPPVLVEPAAVMELGQVDLESTKSQAVQAKEAEALAEQGEDVVLALRLPGGAVDRQRFKVGTTVAFVKLTLSNAHPDLPMAKLTLKYKGKALIDPLSLSDCGIAVGGEADVEVLVG